MKNYKIYFPLIITIYSFFSTYTSEQPSPSSTTQVSSWFSYFTAPFVEISKAIKKSYATVKNYLFPQTTQEIETIKTIDSAPIVDKLPILLEPQPTQTPFIPREVPSAEVERIIIPEQQKEGVFYNCAENRLELWFKDKREHYFNFVDNYTWSPQKRYILATEFTSSTKQGVFYSDYSKPITKLVDPTSNEKEMIKFENIKTYQFSPQETKMLILSLYTKVWQLLGTVEPSAENEEPTGIIKKSDQIFTYYIFDINSKKLTTIGENITEVSFNNEVEITIYFESGLVVVRRLDGIFGKLLKTASQPLPQQINYNPHENKLTLLQTKLPVTFDDVNRFYYSPKKKYLLIESPASWTQYGTNTFKGVNTSIPTMRLINTETGIAINHFPNEVTAIINYEFSPEETTILCKIRTNKSNCQYRLFDIKKEDFIMVETELEKAESAYFNNENELTIIDSNNNEKPITIERLTLEEDIATSYGQAAEEMTESVNKLLRKAREAKIPITKIASRIIERTGQIPGYLKETLSKTSHNVGQFFSAISQTPTPTPTPIHELEEVVIEQPEESEEESEEDEDELFSSVTEKALYEFKKYVNTDENKTKEVIETIFNELASDEIGFNKLTKKNEKISMAALSEFYAEYSHYTPEMQKKFIDTFLTIYTNKPLKKKENFVSLLFTAPEGILYKKNGPDRKGAKNRLNTVAASIHNKMLMITGIKSHAKLGSFYNQKTIRIMLFNEKGTCLAISYKDQINEKNTRASLHIFTLQQDATSYKEHNISMPNESGIIGLLFMNDTLLLCLHDNDYSITTIDVEKNIPVTEQQKEMVENVPPIEQNIEEAAPIIERESFIENN